MVRNNCRIPEERKTIGLPIGMFARARRLTMHERPELATLESAIGTKDADGAFDRQAETGMSRVSIWAQLEAKLGKGRTPSLKSRNDLPGAVPQPH